MRAGWLRVEQAPSNDWFPYTGVWKGTWFLSFRENLREFFLRVAQPGFRLFNPRARKSQLTARAKEAEQLRSQQAQVEQRLKEAGVESMGRLGLGGGCHFLRDLAMNFNQ